MDDAERHALVTVLAERRSPLLRCAWSYVRDVELAEDLVREATRRLLARPPRERTPRAFGAFLFMTIRRLGVDALRARRRAANADQVARSRARRAASSNERSDPVVERAALADTLRAVLSRAATLTELERRAVQLVHFEHETTSAAAIRLGTTTKSIDRALRRAYPKLAAASAAPVDDHDLPRFLEGPSATPRASLEVADIDHVAPCDDESAA